MKCPKCGNPSEADWSECARCGLVFSKYREGPRPAAFSSSSGRISRGSAISGYMLGMKTRPGTAGLYARGVLLLLLLLWGLRLSLTPVQAGMALGSFLHLVNLPFHEAGHFFFGFTGSRLVTSLGGSLMQLLMPLLCSTVLLVKTRDPFGASVALWWFGENFVDLAPYVADARSMSLPLIGGNTGATAPYGFHDWNFILTETRLLENDHRIAGAAVVLGALLMLLSIIWGAAVLLGHREGGADA